ncbi:MAG: aspartate-semialdehyde dehydrogenase [Anaerolineae bacterium]
MEKVKVGILGATGMVGQRFVQFLTNHPWFEVTVLAASDRSVGFPYGEVCRWALDGGMPEKVKEIKVKACTPDLACQLVFSALPSEVAGPIEERFAAAGYAVCSNSASHRLDPDVPLLVPEVNPDHLALTETQRWKRGWSGFIVTNPNCSTTPLVVALKPLQTAFGLKRVFVTTMQALSGAGYPGMPSLDILDNVVPYIDGEEGKIEREPLKLLGALRDEEVQEADLTISAQCNRVNVVDGHLECVSVELEQRAGLEDVLAALEGFTGLPQELGLPSAPFPPIVVRREGNRPQPRLDRDSGGGMAVVVGRVRPCPILDYKFLILGHNTVRGAAGGAILNAELLKVQGYLD